jgi:hypothetical protein
LNAFARQFDQQVTVLAINVEEPSRLVQDFAQGENSPLYILMDYDGIVSDHYKVSSFPTTFVLNPAGIIHKVVPGDMTAAEMGALVTFENEP